MLEELVQNPEKYRVGENYRATNIVFPVRYEGRKYIAKGPRMPIAAMFIHSYYGLTETITDPINVPEPEVRGIQREIETLQRLDGICAPKLYAANSRKPLLIREYIDGASFSELSSSTERQNVLRKAFQALTYFHAQGVVVGDTHVKNILFTKKGDAYWIDFDGLVDTHNEVAAKAADLLKFVLTTYTVTRNRDDVLFAVKMVLEECDEAGVTEKMKEKFNEIGSLSLWASTRISPCGQVRKNLKEQLMR